MRRVLLSSLPGAAVNAVKIKGVDHEFAPIPGVKEEAFLHRSMLPLEDAILTDEDLGQGTLFAGFGAECEGMCGL